jgi:hypothetical protein
MSLPRDDDHARREASKAQASKAKKVDEFVLFRPTQSARLRAVAYQLRRRVGAAGCSTGTHGA